MQKLLPGGGAHSGRGADPTGSSHRWPSSGCSGGQASAAGSLPGLPLPGSDNCCCPLLQISLFSLPRCPGCCAAHQSGSGRSRYLLLLAQFPKIYLLLYNFGQTKSYPTCHLESHTLNANIIAHDTLCCARHIVLEYVGKGFKAGIRRRWSC